MVDTQLKIGIIGGDRRHIYLAEGLIEEGLDASLHAIGDLGINEGRLKLCEVLILPAPATDGEGKIRTPLWGGTITAPQLVSLARPGALLLAGMPGADLTAPAAAAGLVVNDYFTDEALTVHNALITAEGALMLALSRREHTLWGSRVLLTGMGRISKLLLSRLVALGADVTVAARRPEQRKWAELSGARAVDFAKLHELAGGFSLVFNTVPHMVIDAAVLSALPPHALVIDLASRPGGVDFESARTFKIDAEWALGLPGKTAPRSAAAALKQALLSRAENKGML